MARVMVAMSGGVDSSLAAALLLEQGHDVTGVTMHLWEGDDERLAESLCCSQEIAESARRVCRQLGIPYYVFNYQAEFRRFVIEYFLREYSQGFTPNPCLECNREVKFRALLARAEALGFEYVATGHYARVGTMDGGRGATDGAVGAAAAPSSSVHRPPPYALLRARDREKDQSYMLHMLGQRELARLLFPIGELTKAEVRAAAAARCLASADRPESQDICFVPGGDYRNLLREERPESLRPGPILDESGRELGQHAGLPLYTVGQRRGLGLGGGRPLYVTRLDAARNAVIVGPASALERCELRATRVSFVSGVWPFAPFRCQVQIRSHAAAANALVEPLAEGAVRVRFDAPQRAITPGQAAVFYDGEHVLGGGRICPDA